jgi:hypothetical protein
MYSAKKNNRVKQCKIIELPPKLLSKHSILAMVFKLPTGRETPRQEQGWIYLRFFSMVNL